nr:hypothetical protein [Thauera sp. K11]
MRSKQTCQRIWKQIGVVVQPQVEIELMTHCRSHGDTHPAVPEKISIPANERHGGKRLTHCVCRAVGTAVIDEEHAEFDLIDPLLFKQRLQTVQRLLTPVETGDHHCNSNHMSSPDSIRQPRENETSGSMSALLPRDAI